MGWRVTRCPRCRGAILHGECLMCSYDVTIDRYTTARQIEPEQPTRGPKITYAKSTDALRRHARERLERKAKRVKA